MTLRNIGFHQALELVRDRVRPAPAVALPLVEAAGHVVAEDVVAKVDSPSVSASSRDGFAVLGADVASCSEQTPCRLRVLGTIVAGGDGGHRVGRGECVEVMTGAGLPEGADTVVSVELCRREGDRVEVLRATEVGRNVIARGCDVRAGALLIGAGTRLRPAMAGLAAAGGITEVRVHPRPRVAVVATGDEVVAPGRPLRRGQLYASNVVTLQAWLTRFGIPSTSTVVPDDDARLAAAFEQALEDADALLTSGGAWLSRRDRTVDALRSLGFEIHFHRVRLAPGKAVAFGVRGDQIAFCLPGGPPSNEMAFLQLALPGLLARAGDREPPFETVRARLRGSVRKQRPDPTWTNFFQADLVETDDGLEVTPARDESRLVCQARAESLILLPEGLQELTTGAVVEVQKLG